MPLRRLVPEQKQPPGWGTKRAPRYGPKLRQLQQARREERLARYEQVIARQKLGMSQRAIALQVNLSQQTVQRWLAAGYFPEKKQRKQTSQIDRYLPYLFARWEAECHNMARLCRELEELGYQGSYASVRNMLLRFFPDGHKPGGKTTIEGEAPVLPRAAVFLFLRRPKDLEHWLGRFGQCHNNTWPYAMGLSSGSDQSRQLHLPRACEELA